MKLLKTLTVVLGLSVLGSVSSFAEPPTKDEVLKMSGKGYRGYLDNVTGKTAIKKKDWVFYTQRGDGKFQLGFGTPGSKDYSHDGLEGPGKSPVQHQVVDGHVILGFSISGPYSPSVPAGTLRFKWVSTKQIELNWWPAGVDSTKEAAHATGLLHLYN